MLYVEPDEMEVVPAGRTKCSVERCERYASWKFARNGQAERHPFCGWCVLYSGETQWGHDNRAELAHVGEFVRAQALRSANKNVLVPELDAHHRLDAGAAERLLMGIVFTSRTLKSGPLGRMVEVGARAREMLDDDDSK